ncbi:hypothetical protein [Pseudomonas frederiksbergensis]|uniref:hypothetical protein n=1 Tax=Pseudomonas frederiksbergensis TaxID=104087 RepID=UPI000FF285D8|nr:hypothetical protein [Pseudomonas frederiksbergensis]RON47903.1 hypothetical protein BK667_21785 [Pseudomonas frederiksbergensis]
MSTHNDQALTATPGDLDPEFGLNGIYPIPSFSGSFRGVVEVDGGRFVYTYWESGECVLGRGSADGIPDTGFGQGGYTRWAFHPGKESIPAQLLRAGNGKILLVGAVRTEIERSQAAITRFNANGSPDLIFGNVILPFPAEGNITSGFPTGCLQADGKILLAQQYYRIGDGFRAIVVRRLLADGQADISFGEGRGFIEVRFKDQNSSLTSLAVLPDEKILVGGQISRASNNTADMAVARFLPSGDLDVTFGNSGYWELKAGYSNMQKMIVHKDKIICAGNVSQVKGFVMAMARVTVEGVFDPDFNGGELLTINIPSDSPGYNVSSNAVNVQSDEKIVVAGTAGQTSAFWLRLLPKGALDLAFGNRGIGTYNQVRRLGGAIVLNASQRIVIALDTRPPLIVGVLG